MRVSSRWENMVMITWSSRNWWKTNQVSHLLSPLSPPRGTNHDHPPESSQSTNFSFESIKKESPPECEENHGCARQDEKQQGFPRLLLQGLRVQQPTGAAWQGVCFLHSNRVVSQPNSYFHGESSLLLSLFCSNRKETPFHPATLLSQKTGLLSTVVTMSTMVTNSTNQLSPHYTPALPYMAGTSVSTNRTYSSTQSAGTAGG